MKNSKVEFLFLKTSIEQFCRDLATLEKMMAHGVFLDDELLEIMSYLVAAKENIELLEVKYQRLDTSSRA